MNRSALIARVAPAGVAMCLCFASARGQETGVPASPSVAESPAPPPVAAEPAPAQNLSAAPLVAPAPDTAGLTTYTVQKGDSLWKIGKKFGVSVDVLLLANGLKSDHVLQIGDALKIPPKQAKAAPGEPPPAGTPAPALQPGQYMVRQGDTLWDIARAHGVSVQEILKANNMKSNRLQIGQILNVPPAPPGAMPQGPAVPAAVAPAPTPPPAPSEPAIRPMEPAPAPAPAAPAPVPAPAPPGSSSYRGAPGASVSAAFVRETQELAARRIRYAQRWRPPGQREPWLMDCSNTSRYLYRRVAGIDIGRTASDQYYLLHRRGLAWRVPASLEGAALVDHLTRNLRSGDLLFWENTYKPKRNPPVTHVMVYLGRTREGRLMMAGSQSHGAGRDPAVSGGPDLYFFDPLAPAGGYSSWLGFVRVKGRFAAFGRPLAAPGASGALTAAVPAARPSI